MYEQNFSLHNFNIVKCIIFFYVFIILEDVQENKNMICLTEIFFLLVASYYIIVSRIYEIFIPGECLDCLVWMNLFNLLLSLHVLVCSIYYSPIEDIYCKTCCFTMDELQ